MPDASANARGMLPLVYTRIGVDFSKRFSLFAEVDWMNVTSDKFLDAVAKFRWQINAKWDVVVGWRTVTSSLQIAEVRNEIERDGGLIHFGYSF